MDASGEDDMNDPDLLAELGELMDEAGTDTLAANGRSTLAKQIILRVQNQHVTIRIANCLDRTCRHLREIH